VFLSPPFHLALSAIKSQKIDQRGFVSDLRNLPRVGGSIPSLTTTLTLSA